VTSELDDETELAAETVEETAEDAPATPEDPERPSETAPASAEG
jgi:hypothetical protein